MAANPYFSNFPSLYGFPDYTCSWLNPKDLADWEWYGSGHSAPDTINDATVTVPQNLGSITLGSGSANSTDYLQAQKQPANIIINTLNKTYWFEWAIQLSSATLTQSLLGVAATNTNLIGSNIANGFGFYANLTAGGAPATGNWWGFLANGSGAQFSGYTQVQLQATDTLYHTLAIKVQTSTSVLGAGSVTFYIDGNQISSGVINSGSPIIPTSAMRLSMAMGNGSGVAQTLTSYAACSMTMR